MCATQATSFELKRTHISNSHNMQFDWGALPTIWMDFLSEIGGLKRKSHESIDSNWTNLWWISHHVYIGKTDDGTWKLVDLVGPSLKPRPENGWFFLNSYVPFWDPESFQVGTPKCYMLEMENPPILIFLMTLTRKDGYFPGSDSMKSNLGKSSMIFGTTVVPWLVGRPFVGRVICKGVLLLPQYKKKLELI